MRCIHMSRVLSKEVTSCRLNSANIHTSGGSCIFTSFKWILWRCKLFWPLGALKLNPIQFHLTHSKYKTEPDFTDLTCLCIWGWWDFHFRIYSLTCSKLPAVSVWFHLGSVTLHLLCTRLWSLLQTPGRERHPKIWWMIRWWMIWWYSIWRGLGWFNNCNWNVAILMWTFFGCEVDWGCYELIRHSCMLLAAISCILRQNDESNSDPMVPLSEI